MIKENITPFKKLRIYQCEDSLPGILTAVSCAYKDRNGHENNRLQVWVPDSTPELFAEYVTVKTDPEAAEKVYRAIYDKIGFKALSMVESVAMSHEEDKGELIYRFLILGFANGPKTTDYIQDDHIYRIRRIHKRIGNESHHWIEFIRFQAYCSEPRSEGNHETAGSDTILPELFGTLRQVPKEYLLAKIGTKEKVLSRIMPHFADRFHGEAFLIFDETHDQLGVYEPGIPWVIYEEITRIYPGLPELFRKKDPEEKRMEELWKIFFEATDIPERENAKLQRNLLPLWHRKYMTEFCSDET